MIEYRWPVFEIHTSILHLQELQLNTKLICTWKSASGFYVLHFKNEIESLTEVEATPPPQKNKKRVEKKEKENKFLKHIWCWNNIVQICPLVSEHTQATSYDLIWYRLGLFPISRGTSLIYGFEKALSTRFVIKSITCTKAFQHYVQN